VVYSYGENTILIDSCGVVGQRTVNRAGVWGPSTRGYTAREGGNPNLTSGTVTEASQLT